VLTCSVSELSSPSSSLSTLPTLVTQSVIPVGALFNTLQVLEDFFCTRVPARKPANISEPRPRGFLIVHNSYCFRQYIQHHCCPASLEFGTLDTGHRGCSRAPPPSRLECSPPRSVLQLHHEYCNHRLILACRSYPLSSLVQVLNVSRHFPLPC
jgi:hypothetical protein